MVVVYYGDNPEVRDRFKARCDKFYEFRGPKWRILHDALSRYDVAKYEYTWFPDDDLAISAGDINAMFVAAARLG